jgi:hypothetical protein
MDLLLLVATVAAVSFGVAGLLFDFRPGMWRRNPPWMFAGTMFCFAAARLAMYGRRQVEAASSLAALLAQLSLAGLIGALVLMLKARRRQEP